ncbi:3beta-hydroxysteroid 3-dehydrogenase [[Candida] zeylanoides]
MSKVCVITGTSSNLGINIAYRVLRESEPATKLTFVVTSRTLPKATEAIAMIGQYAARHCAHRTGQLEFDYVLVDFTDMVSVLSAHRDLSRKFAHIDYFFVNAAQGVYDGIDWLGACREICASPIEGVTNPTYKLQRVGVASADGMGLVFQANVFGPYYLLRLLRPQLRQGGSVVWISSIMGQPQHLSFDDLQSLRSPAPYEGSKRLMDLVHCGSAARLLRVEGIRSHLVHPGIFTSFSFYQYLNVFTYYGMLMLFYIARFLGSPWHNISGYTAALAPVRCAFGETVEVATKTGSATRRGGQEYLVAMPVDATGAEDAVAYLDRLCDEWDTKLQHQIQPTRQRNPPYPAP